MQRWFLSYNSRDLNLVQGLENAIRRKNPQAQIFCGPKSLLAGGYWLPRLAEEIAQATAFVLLVGEKGLGPWQVVEYYEALDRRVTTPDFPLVLVLLEGQSAPGLPFLRQLHWIVTPDPSSEHTAARLVEAGAGEGSRPGELWRYTSPYRGLAAMTDADSDFFFGRQPETRAVLEALGACSERLPVLLGNSGVGKSSLAQAGVLGALKRQGFPEANGGAWPRAFHDSRRWCFLGFKPGTEPLKALVVPFLDIWQFPATDPERTKQQNGWISLLCDGKANLRDLIDATERRYQELDQPKPPAFFIYVDQGEELYVRSAEGERRRFSQLLAQALGDPRVHALMSMRADFLGALQNDEALYAVHHKIDVPPLREAELGEVVSRPAALLSARFETEGLAADIARRTAEESAKDAGALPLLSYLLDDMWTQMITRGDGVLRLPAQAMELGGVLAERANAFLARYPKSEEALRRMLTLKLATVREDGEPTRRIARRSEFTDEEWRMVSELADHPHRLLVTATPEGGETYAEVAHEAIFRRWSKLRDWIVAEREFLVWKSGLEADRRRWEQSPEASRNDALLMGLALAQGQSWLARRAEDLPRPDREFIDLSLRREVLERQQRESLRRRMFGIAIVALVAMTGLAAFSFWQWGEAEGQRREALTQRQMAQQERDRAERAVSTFFLQLMLTAGGQEGMAAEFESPDAGNYMLRALRSFQRQDQDGFLANINRAIELDPRFVAAYMLRGNIYENKKDYERAIAEYDQALRLDPKKASFYNARGWAYHLKGDYNRAIADYDEAIKLHPNFSLAYNNRGFAHYITKDYDLALADYDQAIKLDPKYVLAYNNRGWAHHAKGEYDTAIADFTQAIALEPKNALGYNNRGFAHYTKKDYDLALTDYDRAIELSPNYALAHNNRGVVYRIRGDYDRAIADFGQAIRAEPNLSRSYYHRGSTYRARGQQDPAIWDYEQAVKLDPNEAGSLSARCWTHVVGRAPESGLPDCNRSLQLRADDAYALDGRGLAYLALGRPADALNSFDAALQIEPKLANSLYGRGLAKRKTGDRDGGDADMAAAEAIRPDVAADFARLGIN